MGVAATLPELSEWTLQTLCCQLLYVRIRMNFKGNTITLYKLCVLSVRKIPITGEYSLGMGT